MENQFGKLQTLTVKGYKSIRSIDGLALRDLNVVIGQNGAGKSNFVSLFQFLARLAREELQDYVVKQGGLTVHRPHRPNAWRLGPAEEGISIREGRKRSMVQVWRSA